MRFHTVLAAAAPISGLAAAESGVNVAVTLTRYDASEEVISTLDALYLVTNPNGRRGIRFSSRFAP